jgi:Ser/Thr protein kinase RdoA (MazF antagonist)
MDLTKRYVAENDLLKFINQQYPIKGEKIRKYRGNVFYIQSPTGRKVLKLYGSTCTNEAIQTTHIIPYLDGCGFPVVQIIPTVSGKLYVTVEKSGSNYIGVLFEYANGIDIGNMHRWRDNKHPLVNPLAKQVGRSVGLMHRLMENYEKPLIHKGKERFFDTLVWLMRRDNYDKAKARDLEEYGNELWDILKNLPTGFYHADMHTGNTKYRNGQFTWMALDMACMSYPVLDLAWLAETDYGCFHEESIDRSRAVLDEVYAGYSMERTLTDNEINSVLRLIPVIHYGCLVTSVVMCGENEKIDPQQMDNEHDWLMRWRKACDKLT